MNKKLKNVLICLLGLVVVACVVLLTTNKHLAKFSSENITVDVTEKFNIEDYLTDVKDGTDVNYALDLENSHLVINLTNKNKTETLEKDITVIYPRVNVKDDIVIDTFVGYDIKDLVDCEDGVKIDSTLDLDKSEITITYSKGEYTNTILKTVTLTSSNPVDNARFYDCTNIKGVEYKVYVYPDGTLEEWELTTDNVYPGEWEMINANDGEMFHMLNSPSWWRIGLWFSDDSSEASFFVGNDRRGGNSDRDVCKLTGIAPYDESMKLYQ